MKDGTFYLCDGSALMRAESSYYRTQKVAKSMVPMKFLLIGLVLRTQPSQVQAFTGGSHSSPPLIANSIISGKMSSSSSALDMARTRGLERQEEGATPLGKFYKT